jgi:general secretion pathway protein G
MHRRNGTSEHAARGFSLLELMLVVAIIGILMAGVAFRLGERANGAKPPATRASLQTIQTSLDQYRLEYSSNPPALASLIQVKMLKDMKLKDAWDSDFLYDPRGLSPERPYILGSSGPDKSAGNEDDLDVWTMDK